jgi:hypothetical protein
MASTITEAAPAASQSQSAAPIASESRAPPAWPEQVKWVYILCNPQHEKARFERILVHMVMRGVPKERIRVCGPTWGDTLDTQTIFKVYDPFLKRGDLPPFCYKSARLSKGEVSLVLNFFAAVQNAAKDISGDDMVLVFESDAYIRRDFVPRLRETIEQAAKAESAWTCVSLGEGVGTRGVPASRSYSAPTQVMASPTPWGYRCTDSMLFRGSYLQSLVKTLLPFKESLDWELNFQSMLNKGKTLWVDPPLAEQGTTHGREDTLLR